MMKVHQAPLQVVVEVHQATLLVVVHQTPLVVVEVHQAALLTTYKLVSGVGLEIHCTDNLPLRRTRSDWRLGARRPGFSVDTQCKNPGQMWRRSGRRKKGRRRVARW